MPTWLQTALAIAVLLCAAPFAAVFGKRWGGKVKGGMALFGFLLGFGQVEDPPEKNLIEATDRREKGNPDASEPPQPGAHQQPKP
jgi:hypothetical protein